MTEIISQPTAPKVPYPWTKVSLDHLEKTADSLKRYTEKRKAEEAKKKKGK